MLLRKLNHQFLYNNLIFLQILTINTGIDKNHFLYKQYTFKKIQIPVRLLNPRLCQAVSTAQVIPLLVLHANFLSSFWFTVFLPVPLDKDLFLFLDGEGCGQIVLIKRHYIMSYSQGLHVYIYICVCLVYKQIICKVHVICKNNKLTLFDQLWECLELSSVQ